MFFCRQQIANKNAARETNLRFAQYKGEERIIQKALKYKTALWQTLKCEIESYIAALHGGLCLTFVR